LLCLCSTLFPYSTLFRSTRGDFGYGFIWRLAQGNGQASFPDNALTQFPAPFPAAEEAIHPRKVYIMFINGCFFYERCCFRDNFRSEEHTSELQSRENLVC